MTRNLVIYLFLIIFLFSELKAHMNLEPPNYAFDLNLYEAVLDHEKCVEQLDYLISSDRILGLRFLDAGMRVPKGILIGNFVDLGNYHQCIAIQEGEENLYTQGKYCTIQVPIDQEIQVPLLGERTWPEWPEWPGFPWMELNSNTTRIDKVTLKNVQKFNQRKTEVWGLKGVNSDRSAILGSSDLAFSLAICIPKTCTTKEFIDIMLFNITELGLNYHDDSCRLADDKPWVPADYLAIVIFSLIGLLTALSTFYDIRHSVILKKDPKQANPFYQSLSLYTNTQRILMFESKPGVLECLDGIRSLAMIWIILGHTFSTQTVIVANPLDGYEWLQSFRSVWVVLGLINVDTFFMLNGLLLVYTTAGKIDHLQLLKNIHLFYLHRLLRFFPILAAMILAQVSFLNQVDDGPLWGRVTFEVESCRTYWWTTLLYMQNYAHPGFICISHSWYLAIDVQLYILSPLVLVWVLMEKRSHIKAWIALIAALIISLASATTYNAIKQFPSTSVGQTGDTRDYTINYYINTLTRASPVFVGMLFGYILHTWRGTKKRLSQVLVIFIWLLISALYGVVIYLHHAIVQENWDNKTADVFINSFMRSIWAVGLGCMIVACVHGYGGPINWLLSHRIWKLPSRLSYAMYIVHYPMMVVIISRTLNPFHFTVKSTMFNFLGQLLLTFLVSYLITVSVDMPFANIVKLLLRQDFKKTRPPPGTQVATKKEDKANNDINTTTDGTGVTNYAYNNTEGKMEPTTEL